MQYLKILASFFILLSLSVWGYSEEQKFAHLGDFCLESGEIIQNCIIGYRTFGKLNEQKSNAILFPTWFGGTSESLSYLIGSNKFVDSNKYFVIAVDALGNGVSSSPSNSTTQKCANFPLFTIRDMVHSEYYLVTKVLQLSHLYGVIGGSMGGMQVFEWIVTYPNFVDKAVSYVGTPFLTAYDLLLWHTMLHTIETGKRYNCPEEDIIKTQKLIMTLVLQTPSAIVQKTSPQDFPKFLASVTKSTSSTFSSDNYASQLKAMIHHDITVPFENSLEKASSVVKAKLFILVASQDHTVYPEPSLEFAKLLDAKTMVLDNNRGHLGPGYELQRVSEILCDFWDNN